MTPTAELSTIPAIILFIYFLIGALLAIDFVCQNKQRIEYFYSAVVAETCLLFIGWPVFVIMAVVRMLSKGDPK